MNSGFQLEAKWTEQNGAVALGGCPARCRKQVERARLLQRADHVVVLDKVSNRLSSTLEMVVGLSKVPSRLSSTLEMVDGLSMVPSRLSSTLEMVDGLSMVGLSIGSPRTPYSRLACEQCGASMRTYRFTFILLA